MGKNGSATSDKRDGRGRFEKGHRKIGGRSLGTPNRVTQVMSELVYRGMGGRDGITDFMKRLADEDPRLAAKLLCKIVRKGIKTVGYYERLAYELAVREQHDDEEQ